MNRFFYTLVSFAIFFQAPLVSGEDHREKMLADVETIRSAFAVKYAPAEWKQEYLGWSLDREIDQLKKTVSERKSLTEGNFRTLLRQFFASTHDYHVDVFFYSTEFSSLPFRMKGINGRYFVVAVDPYETVPLKVGDEVISFNHKPIAESIAQWRTDKFGNRDSLTDQALAEISFTIRAAESGDIVPQGKAVVRVKRKERTAKGIQEKDRTFSIDWDYFPEMVQWKAVTAPLKMKKEKDSIRDNRLLNRKRQLPFYEKMRRLKKIRDSRTLEEQEVDVYMSIGSRRGHVPPLGQILWQTADDCPFYAYIFSTKEGKKHGFLRIPHFEGDEWETSALVDILSLFQKETDALVIDGSDNPGGYDWYMFSILSMLHEKPQKVTVEKRTLTQKDVMDAYVMLEHIDMVRANPQLLSYLFGESLLGYPVNSALLDVFEANSSFLLEEWQAGKSCTSFFPVDGLEEVPCSKRALYTKPIVLYVNELSVSCGDFFPAILQDNQQALIVGSKTAGAGGTIEVYSHPNLFGVGDYSLTTSYALRPNGNPIENEGITPDIPLVHQAETWEGAQEEVKELLLNALQNSAH